MSCHVLAAEKRWEFVKGKWQGMNGVGSMKEYSIYHAAFTSRVGCRSCLCLVGWWLLSYPIQSCRVLPSFLLPHGVLLYCTVLSKGEAVIFQDCVRCVGYGGSDKIRL